MEIYVQSRGISKDYSWLDQNQTRISDLPDNFKGMLKMVDGDYFSLVIYRANGQLSLLVTALKSQNRIDNQTRKIKNSLLWVGKDSDEATLRKLAIQALNGELEAKVDPAVVSENNAQGFTVNFDRLKPENLGLASVENNPADSAKIGNLSALKNDLIGDLKKYALPKDDGMLVVVCSTVSKSSLEGAQVWRGLSDQISDDDWTELPVKGDKGDNFLRQPSSSFSSNTGTTVSNTGNGGKSGNGDKSASANSQNNAGKNNGNNGTNKRVKPKQGLTIIDIVLSCCLVGSLLINAWLYSTWQNAIKNQRDNDTLRKENQEFIKDNENLKNQLQEGEKELKEFIQITEQFNKQGRELIDNIDHFIKDYDKVVQGIQK